MTNKFTAKTKSLSPQMGRKACFRDTTQIDRQRQPTQLHPYGMNVRF